MASVFFGSVEISDTSIIHDSTKEVFRNPPGALRCGTVVHFAVEITGLCVEHASLCMLKGDTVDRITMESAGNLLCARYTVPSCVDGGGIVLWYWFELVVLGGAVCYYGAEPPYPSGLGRVYQSQPPAFQLTVYDREFKTPDWAKSAIMYQIFPDRFCMGDLENVSAGVKYHQSLGRLDIELHENWNDIPVYKAKEGQLNYTPTDIFGGDIEGIRQRLPYLKSLGITLIYLNPVFEAASNHRYNTGDYLKIDPILGDEKAFNRLVNDARELGIRIILDGVFSHTGDDSLYFNRYGRYESLGAYQSKDSPYFCWFRFDDHPARYARWWGFESLPEVDEHDPGWQEYVISGPQSVIRQWLSAGVAGYRLDVADELPDKVIELIRTAAKEADPEAFVLGEVWEDATTKFSYGRQRTYALGRGLDSVMNYPFLNSTVEFLKGKCDARQYQRFLLHQQHAYPAPMYYTLMNLLSSHDVCRVRSILGGNYDASQMPREQQALAQLAEDEFLLGGLRQRLAAAIQYSLPGIPAVYYGDEVGMTGLLDPFNRRTWREEDPAMVDWYRWLGNLRRQRPVMSTGFARFFATNGKVLGILRHTVRGCDFFGNKMDSDAVLTLVNPTDEAQRIVLDMPECDKGTVRFCHDDKGTVRFCHNPEDSLVAASLLSDSEILLDNGLMEVNMLPCSVEIFGVER